MSAQISVTSSTSLTNALSGYYHTLSSTEAQFISDYPSNNIYNVYLTISNLYFTGYLATNISSFTSYYYYTLNGVSSTPVTDTISFINNEYAINTSDTPNIILPYSFSTTTKTNGMTNTFCIPLMSIPSTVSTSNIFVGFEINTLSTATSSSATIQKAYVVALSSLSTFSLSILDNSDNNYSLPPVTLGTISSTGPSGSSTFSLIPSTASQISASTMLGYITTDFNSYGCNFTEATFNATAALSSATFTGTVNSVNTSLLVVSSVTGTIYVGMTLTGGVTTGTYVASIITSGSKYGIAGNSNSFSATSMTGSTTLVSVDTSSLVGTLYTVLSSTGSLNTLGGSYVQNFETTGLTTGSLFQALISTSGTTSVYTLSGNTSTVSTSTSTSATLSVGTTSLSSFQSGYTTTIVSTGNYRQVYVQPAGFAGDEFNSAGYFCSTTANGSPAYYSTITDTPYQLFFNKYCNYQQPGPCSVSSLYSSPTLTQTTTSGVTTVNITTNSIPIHPTGNWDGVIQETTPYTAAAFYIGQNPGTVEETNYSFTISNNTSGGVTAMVAGTIGWVFDNCPIYAPEDATNNNPMFKEVLDLFGGHPDEDFIYHHHSIVPSLYNWVVDYQPRVIGFMCDGYPIVTPFLVYDSTTGAIRTITATDLNINNGLTFSTPMTFSFVYGGTTQSYSYNFCYVAINCFPYHIGAFYGTPSYPTTS